MKKYFIYTSIIAFSFNIGCKPTILKDTIVNGNADFSKYIAVGNSLCAGYTDGGLDRSGQENSFPVMLAQQFKLAGGGNFSTPWLSASGNGNDGFDSTQYTLVVKNGSPTPIRKSGLATSLNDNASISIAGPYQHLGIPGIRAIDINQPYYAALNKFLGRITKNPLSGTLINEAMQNNATFFTYWLGSNDVLAWATNGGTGSVQTTTGWTPPGALTSPSSMAYYAQLAIDSLTKNGAKGAIANIPDVASTPYFTTVPFNAINMTSTSIVSALNAGYAAFNAMVPDTSKIIFKLGLNPIVIEDAQAPGGMRFASKDDLICLPAASLLSSGAGSATPLANKYVLDRTELLLARSYTNQYNDILKSIAAAKGLAYVDANSFLKTFSNSLVFNGVSIGPKFVEGGGFSLDGVHPTPRGYALIANEFIKAINRQYASNVPMVDVNKYRAVPLP